MKIPFRWSANATLFVVAAVAGLTAFWWSQRFLSQSAAVTRERFEQRFQMRPTLVASIDLAAGHLLTAADLAQRPMPAGFLASGSLAAAQQGDAIGRRLLLPLRAGDPISRSVIEPRQTPSLAQRLESGARALTVPVDEVSSQAGLVRPGDRVDLMLAEERNDARGRCVLVRPLLDAVHVLATGQATRDRADSEALGSPTGVRYDDSYSTMTLDVTPEQAQALTAALRLGELIPTLRGLDDAAPAGIAAQTAGHGGCAVSAASQANRAPSRSVPVDLMIGGVDPLQIARRWVPEIEL